MRICVSILLLFWSAFVYAQQQVIPLYPGKAPGSENWNWEEKESSKNMFNTPVVYNVVKPTLTVFLPPAARANGTAVIVAPGGAFHTLSINSEGTDVARWLNERGVAAFVLKYRLVRSLTQDPVAELMAKMGNFKRLDEENDSVVTMAVADGLKAVEYVRSHAAEFNINPQRVGFMGFSAGGTVTMGTVFNGKGASRPDFAAPIYPYMNALKKQDIPADAPPLFICAASDDQLGLATHSSNLYNAWINAKQTAELHMYEKGGHGYGMHTNNIPTDTWIDRFGDWLELHGWLMREGNGGNVQQVRAWRKAEEERQRTDWANLKKYAAENKALGSVKAGEKRVVFMGNSITEGWKNFDSAFFAGRPYIDRGISGQTTPQMLLRFRADVIDLKPAVVVILAGINDIAQNTGPMTLEQTYGNIVSMAELAKASGIKVVLCSVVPAFDFPWRPGMQPAEKVVQLNGMIKNYAAQNNIAYVDYFSAMADSRKGLKQELTYDGVHPNLAGYKVMAPLVERGIAEALKRK